jgi:hypothetical protein
LKQFNLYDDSMLDRMNKYLRRLENS